MGILPFKPVQFRQVFGLAGGGSGGAQDSGQEKTAEATENQADNEGQPKWGHG
jgi:hypothetical protein